MMASLTRQCLSSAKATIAGKRFFWSSWIPMMLLTSWRLLMIFSLTSGYSSLSRVRMIGRTLASTVSAFPKMGEITMTTVAMAARTCCEVSLESSVRAGRISFRDSGPPTKLQNSAAFPAAATRTSASLSFKSFTYSGTSSLIVTSSPITSHSSYTCCATMYRTLQDLSTENFWTVGRILEMQPSFPRSLEREEQLPTASSLTESWSSSHSSANIVITSFTRNSFSSFSAYAPRCWAAALRTIGVSSFTRAL
mmetsp:Transcript_18026/g.37130  ORF Transcript_18026/g.37130 Transcript_18026/m.37130 type:complete len:252 (-) Transcript_18026:715-1470(-)